MARKANLDILGAVPGKGNKKTGQALDQQVYAAALQAAQLVQAAKAQAQKPQAVPQSSASREAASVPAPIAADRAGTVLAALEAQRQANPFPEMGPSPKMVNQAYADFVLSKRNAKTAIQEAGKASRQAMALDPRLNYYARSLGDRAQRTAREYEKRVRNLDSLYAGYEAQPTQERADAFDRSREELEKWVDSNRGSLKEYDRGIDAYRRAVEKAVPAQVKVAEAAQRQADSQHTYSQLLQGYQLNRSAQGLSAGVKADMRQRAAQEKERIEKYYQRELDKIDQQLGKMSLNPSGYIDTAAAEKAEALKEQRDQLQWERNEGINPLEKAQVILEAGNDPQFSQYVQAGEDLLNAEIKALGADASWKESADDLTGPQKDMYAYLVGKDGNRQRAEEYRSQVQTGRRKRQAMEAQRQEDYRLSNRYMQLKHEPDFQSLSQYRSTENGKEVERILGSTELSESGFDDIEYDYINGNPKAQKILESTGSHISAQGAGVSRAVLKHMTPNEVKVYNYYYAKEGQNRAAAYLKELEPALSRRQRKADEAAQAKEAGEHPVRSSVFSVLQSPLKGVSYVGQILDIADDGKIDQNAGYNKFSYLPAATRSEVSKVVEKKWGAPGSFLYQTGMSMGDFLLNTGITGGNEALSLALMGTGAAADSVIAAKDRGLSDFQAFALGTIAGAAEIATEKYSVEALLDKTTLGKDALGYFLQNVLTEGSEEVESDLINWMADVIISQDKSEWKQAIAAYQDQGFSKRDAFLKALTDQAAQMGLDFLGGALSGGVMAGAGIAGNKAISGIYNRQQERLANRLMEFGLTKEEANTLLQYNTGLQQAGLDENIAGTKALRGALLDSGILGTEQFNTLLESQGAQPGSGGEAQPAAQYSLNTFEDGKRFVDVQTDQAQFDGLSESEKARLATRIIKERFTGKVIGIDNPVFVNGNTATEYGYPARHISGEIKEAKAQASTELDNLIDAGTNFRTAPDGADGHIHSNATGGFSYFDTIFKVGRDYYKGIVNVVNTNKGRLLKDITKIENITQDISSSYGTNPKSTFLRDTSIPSIPTSAENVNYPAPFGMNPLEWGRRMRNANHAKTSLEKTAALYDVAPEVYAATEKLAKETGARIVFDGTLGANVNGYYQNGEIHINPVTESFTTVFSHELTHHLEGTGSYQALSDYVLSRFVSKEAISKAIEQKIAEYKRSSKGRVELSSDEARAELVAEYISKNLFTNEAEISRLAQADLTLAQRVKNFISRLAAKVTGNVEKQFLLNAERLYAKAIGEARKASQQESGAGREMLDTKFSLSQNPENNGELAKKIDKASHLLDNGSTPSEVFNETGLLVMANGDIYSGIGGQKIGVYQRGNTEMDTGANDKNLSSHAAGVDRRADRGGMAEDSGALRLSEWEKLGGKARDEIISAVKRRMEDAGYEGSRFVENMGGIEAFTQRFYSMLQKGRPVAEQLANAVPDIQGLMDEIEAVGAADSRGPQYSLEDDVEMPYDGRENPDYQQMIEEYGAIPEGEKPHGREVQVPQSTDGEDVVSKYARTLMEAPQTPEEFLPAFQQQVVNGLFSHNPARDKDSLDRAVKTIKEHGWQEGLKRWQQVVDEERRATKDDIVLAQVMYAEAAKVGDMETSQRLAAEIAAEGTLAGQEVQALRLLKRTTPEGQLYYIQKTVKSLEDGLRRKYGKKWEGKSIEINKQLAQDFLTAQTEEERTEALNALYDDVARQIPPTKEDRFNAWRYLAMLGNPRTHIRNIVGNVAFYIPVQAKDAVGAGLERVFIRNPEGRTKSIFVTDDARNFAKEDYKKMADVMGGGKYSEMQEIKSRQKVLPGVLDKASKLNSKALDMEDAFFKRATYISSMAQFLTARKVDVSNIDENTLEQARSYAINEALRATFNDASALANAIGRLERTNAASKFIIGGMIPFKRTPINIVKRGIEYSPVGLVKGITYDLVQVRNGKMTAAQAIDHISAGLVGSSIAALGMFMRAMGWISGEGDEDDKKRRLDEALGSQNYALNIGDYTYTIDWAAPAALPLFVGVELWDALAATAKGDHNGDLTFKSVMESTEKLLNPMLELTMMSGVSDILSSAVYAQEGMMSSALITVGTSYLGQFVPTLLGQIARTIDPTSRTTYHQGDSPLPKSIDKFWQKQANKIPGLSQNQIPYTDVWGRPEVNENVALRAFENFLSPGYIDKRSSSPAEEELLRLYQATGDSVILPSRPQTTLKIDGNEVHLKAGEYAQYAAAKGQQSLKLLNQAVKNPMYQNMNDLEKAAFVAKLYQYADQTAKNKIVGFVPEKWVKGIQEAVEAGIPADTAIAYRAWILNSDMDSMEKCELLQEMQLTDKQKRVLYEREVSDSHGERIDAVLGAGLTFNDFLSIQNEYSYYNADDMLEPAEKATEFSHWFDQQYDSAKAAKIKDEFKFFSFAPASTSYDKFTAAGMSEDGAYALNTALGELEPLEGNEKVIDAQRLEEIVFSGNYTEQDVQAALSVTMGDSYEKLTAAQGAGISTAAYMDYYLGIKDLGADKDENGNSIRDSERIKVLTYIDDIPGLSNEQKDWLYTQKKYAASRLGEAPWYGGARYEGALPEHYTVKDGDTGQAETQNVGKTKTQEEPPKEGETPPQENTGGSGSNTRSSSSRSGDWIKKGGQAVVKTWKEVQALNSGLNNFRASASPVSFGNNSGTRARSITVPKFSPITRSAGKAAGARKIIMAGGRYGAGIASQALSRVQDGKLKKL